MKALLDTHVFLWWITDDPQLSARVREILADTRTEVFFSVVCGWEIAIKARLGRLQLPIDLERFLTEQLNINGFQTLPVQLAHALQVYRLPDHHRDPFDRLLIAQSQSENLPILSRDRQFAAYGVELIW